jgi:hypothetical protein
MRILTDFLFSGAHVWDQLPHADRMWPDLGIPTRARRDLEQIEQLAAIVKAVSTS